MDVFRLDVGAALSKVERTDEGYLVAPGVLTRTGVFPYTRADGSIQRELRLDEEVFAPASLKSFHLRPLTRGHPPGLLSSKTARRSTIGTVANARRADDGQHVEADVVIHDADTVEAVERGERELSNGYRCRLDVVPNGVHRFADGTEVRADFYQRDIRGNHVAIVPKGRAGASASIRLDSAGDVIPDDPLKEDSAMAATTVDLAAENATLKADIAQLKARTDAADELAKTRADAAAESEKLKGENAALKTKLDAVEAKERKAVHLDLCAQAGKVLGVEPSSLERLDAAAVMTQVLAKQCPELKIDGRSEEFVRAAFETSLAITGATRSDSAAAAAKAAAMARGAAAERSDDKTQRAVAESHKKHFEAWKLPAIQRA